MELSAVLKDIATTKTYKNFKLYYNDNPVNKGKNHTSSDCLIWPQYITGTGMWDSHMVSSLKQNDFSLVSILQLSIVIAKLDKLESRCQPFVMHPLLNNCIMPPK